MASLCKSPCFNSLRLAKAMHYQEQAGRTQECETRAEIKLRYHSSSRSDSYGNAYQNLSTISFDDDVLDAGRLFAGTRWHRPESDTILIVSPEFESKLCTELRPKFGSEFGSRFRSKFRLFR